MPAFLAVPLLLLATAPTPTPAAVALAAPPPAAVFDARAAARFAALALACVGQEYPNKIAHVLAGDADVRPPRELTPAFYGCFDWHSAVHGHWLLARLARLYPDAPFAAARAGGAGASLTAEKIAAEVRYLEGAGRADVRAPVRPRLAAAARRRAARVGRPRGARVGRGARAARGGCAAAGSAAWLPKLTPPDPRRRAQPDRLRPRPGARLGARRAATPAARPTLRARAARFYLADRDCPLGYEPSGQDFLSPCLAEADAVRRVLAAGGVRRLARRLPARTCRPDGTRATGSSRRGHRPDRRQARPPRRPEPVARLDARGDRRRACPPTTRAARRSPPPPPPPRRRRCRASPASTTRAATGSAPSPSTSVTGRGLEERDARR